MKKIIIIVLLILFLIIQYTYSLPIHKQFPLVGEWEMKSQFDFLTQNKGKIQIYSPIVLSDINETETTTILENHIEITDGLYGQDDVYNIVSFIITESDETYLNGFISSKLFTSVSLRTIRKAVLNLNVTELSNMLPTVVLDISYDEFMNEENPIESLTGSIIWENQEMNFTVHTLDKAEREQSAMPYLGFTFVVGLVSMFTFANQLDNTKSESSLKRSSYITVIFLATEDAFLCQLHVYLASYFRLQSLSFAYSLLIIFMYFIIFSIFDIKYMFSIYRAQYGEISQRNAMILYLKLYTALFILFILSTISFRFFLFICSCMWIPQIIHNCKLNNTGSVKLTYVFLSSFTRLLLICYWFLYPNNFLHYRRELSFVFIMFSSVIVQLCILYLQQKKGPRWFIPQWILNIVLEKQYNYHRNWDDLVELRGNLECVICMCPIDNTYMYTGCQEIVVTPCNHVFHSDCLANWNDYKMDCPTCRAPIETSF